MVEGMGAAAIRAHSLTPLAAMRWRAVGRPLPDMFQQQERAAQLAPLLAIPVLTRARAAFEGRMLVLKGPEIEARYPAGGRLFGDLDLLVDDAPAAFASLLAAGFQPLPGAADRRPVHLAPIRWPGSSLPVELHIRPNWPRHLTPPPLADLFDAAVPSRVPVDGLEAPAPPHHALIAAAHGWRHMPLRAVRDLVDVAALAAESDLEEIESLAARWDMAGVWRTTWATADWLFAGAEPPLATRLWARNLRGPRQLTVLERHVRRWVAPFWMLPPGRAFAAAAKNVVADARPVGDESWAAKLRRIAWVASHPSDTRSEAARGLENDEQF